MQFTLDETEAKKNRENNAPSHTFLLYPFLLLLLFALGVGVVVHDGFVHTRQLRYVVTVILFEVLGCEDILCEDIRFSKFELLEKC